METNKDFMLNAEELLSIKGGMAENETIIVNCNVAGSGYIIKNKAIIYN